MLPDYFLLKSQVSDGPAINPGTLQAHLAEAYGKTPMYTVTRLLSGSLVHAPGEVKQKASDGNVLKLEVTAWPESGYRILLTRVEKVPSGILWNGAAVASQYLDDARSVIVTLKGCGELKVNF